MKYSPLIEILRSGCWNVKIGCCIDLVGLKNVLNQAKQQSVQGIVINAILQDSQFKHLLQSEKEDKLRKSVMHNYGVYSMLNTSLLRIVDIFEQDGIRPVLLKGHGLAQYYPVPQLRQCGDLDIYIGSDQYENATNRILEYFKINNDLQESNKHVQIRINSTIVELHKFSSTHPNKTLNDIYQKYATEGLNSNTGTYVVGSKIIDTPSDTFNAFYVFYHLWRHFLTEGVGLRQLCDWMMLLHARKDYIDVEYLCQMVSDMRLMKPWKAFAAIIVEYLGAPPEDVPFYDASYTRLAKRILKRILKEGNFGHERSYYKLRKNSYVLMKIHAFWCHFERYVAVFMLFPSHAMNQFAYMFKVGIKAIYQDITQ